MFYKHKSLPTDSAVKGHWFGCRHCQFFLNKTALSSVREVCRHRVGSSNVASVEFFFHFSEIYLNYWITLQKVVASFFIPCIFLSIRLMFQTILKTSSNSRQKLSHCACVFEFRLK